MFERIHPFSDGNGRVGRVLIPFYLFGESPLPADPLIMISHELRINQTLYYEKLMSIQEIGSYIEYLDFYLSILLNSLSKLNSFIKNFIAFFIELKNKLGEIDNNYLAKDDNLYHMSLIIANREIIDLKYIKSKLNKLKEEGLIKKVLSDESIRNLLKQLEANGILISMSKKPLRYRIKDMPALIS